MFEKMKKNKSILIKISSTIFILLIGVVIMQTLANTKKPSNKRDNSTPARKVEIMTTQYGDQRLEINGNGIIESINALNITSTVSGQVVFTKNNLKSGTYVNKGETLISIDKRSAENTLYLARANLINALVTMIPDLSTNQDKTIYNKWSEYLGRLDIETTTEELPETSTQREKVKLSLHNIYSMYYNVKNAELFLSYHTITAPYDAYISEDGITKGSFVNPGQKLIVLIDAHNLEISVPLSITEFNALDLRIGQDVKIFPADSKELYKTGHIVRYDTQLNEQSQSVAVHISLENSELNPFYFPGNYVVVKIPGKLFTNVCKIPRSIVSQNNSVYLSDNFKLSQKYINVLAIQDDYILTDTKFADTCKIIRTILQKPLIGMDITFGDISEEENLLADKDSTNKKAITADIQ